MIPAHIDLRATLNTEKLTGRKICWALRATPTLSLWNEVFDTDKFWTEFVIASPFALTKIFWKPEFFKDRRPLEIFYCTVKLNFWTQNFTPGLRIPETFENGSSEIFRCILRTPRHFSKLKMLNKWNWKPKKCSYYPRLSAKTQKCDYRVFS